LLSRLQEDQRLFFEYRRTRSQRDREALIERFLPLARTLARRYQRGTEPLEDLEQVACLGLVKAVDAFDPSRHTAFSSFAVPTITGSLKRHFRDCGWSVHVPRELQELAQRVQRITDDITADSGFSPTASQIAEQAGITMEQVLEAREAYQALHADSLDRPRHSGEADEQTSLLDTLGTHDAQMGRAFERAALESLIETLDDRDRTIVRLYYQHELTQAQVGRRLGYSQMHVSRLLRQATERLALAAAE
jgi:RNA polymerase sigma-B factor